MEIAPELEIERLVIEDDRPGHIARHDVTVDAVIAVLIGDFVAVPGKEGRYIIIGKDEQKRFLAAVPRRTSGKRDIRARHRPARTTKRTSTLWQCTRRR